MLKLRVWLAGLVLLGGAVLFCTGQARADEPVFVAVFNFAQPGPQSERGNYGAQLADSVRLKIRRQGQAWRVIDKLTMNEICPEPLGKQAKSATVARILADQLGAHIGVYGLVRKTGQTVRAEISCIDLRKGTEPVWSRVFADDTARSRAVIARQIVQAIIGRELWKPVEYGDQPEPTAAEFGKPINPNGSFDLGHAGWERADNVSTFFEPGPPGRRGVLRVRTDLLRDPWLAYRRDLLLGRASPAKPAKVPRDTSYSSVAGLEGVHVRSEWIPAKPGQRYWLTADMCPVSAPLREGISAFPKVFVKGFRQTTSATDGLPERALAELGITPQQFAAMDDARQRKLIARDAKLHPKRYLRECYRWYLPCRGKQGQWSHFAAPFPPAGPLPKNVEYLQIQIYTYWPPGEYLWDNVHLYVEANQKK